MFRQTETPATATEKIRLELEDNEVHKTDTQKPIVITWSKQNLTTNYDARLKLSIWGYREKSIKPELLYIDTLEVSFTILLQFCLASYWVVIF